jgi:hypothetical protein
VQSYVSPERIDTIARATGFKQRESLITPESFLNTVFFCNAQSCPSLSDYSIDLQRNACRSVSKQAFDNRFNERTKAMLTHLLEDIMSSQLKRRTPFAHHHFSEIRVMDSSKFVLPKNLADSYPGYGGLGREAIGQIQFEFELLGGTITELSLESALDTDAEAGMKHLNQVPANTLLIRDLGYCSPKAFESISQQEAYFVSRAKAQWSMYVKQGGDLTQITIQDIKDRLKAQKGKHLDLDIYLGSKQRTPVRLIANLLTEKQTKLRLKKKKANRGKLSKLAEESSCLNLFVTNVEREECSAQQVYELYTLRWQIELIFKTWKSILHLHKIHAMNAIRFECVLLIKFIWVMLNWSILKLFEEATRYELSLHKLTRTIISQSTTLNLEILQSPGLCLNWLLSLCEISIKHHRKEYKKGSKKINEILA